VNRVQCESVAGFSVSTQMFLVSMPPVLHTRVPTPEMCTAIIEVYAESKWLFVWGGNSQAGGQVGQVHCKGEGLFKQVCFSFNLHSIIKISFDLCLYSLNHPHSFR